MVSHEEFLQHREEVIEYIIEHMASQGISKADAITATVAIKFWDSSVVENLYRCINSHVPENVIESIIAHDFNGLANHDKNFLPKSSQFGDK